MFAPLPMARLAVQVVASFSVSKVVADIIKNNVSVVTTADAVKVWTGSAVIASMMVEQSSNHIERVTKDVVDWFQNHKVEVIEKPPTETEV